MNEKITSYIKMEIKKRGIKSSFISDRTGIGYQRLQRILNQNATISGSELIQLCKLLEISNDKLLSLIDDDIPTTSGRNDHD